MGHAGFLGSGEGGGGTGSAGVGTFAALTKIEVVGP